MAKYEFEMKEPIEHCKDCPLLALDEDFDICEISGFCKLRKDPMMMLEPINGYVFADNFKDLPNKQCPLKRLA